MSAANPDTTRPQNTRAIMSFLREHAPFSNMDDTHLAHFAEHATLSFYADGEEVLSPMMESSKASMWSNRGAFVGSGTARKTIVQKPPSKSVGANVSLWRR